MDNSGRSNLTAIVIGATGLVGRSVVEQLIAHPSFNNVIVFARRSTGIHDIKLIEHLINFDKPDEWSTLVSGDILFSTLGTTIMQAGSQDAQYLVDYTYQYRFAKIAANNKVVGYSLVSSIGARPSSKFFYTRMKGELEMAIKELAFGQTDIFQPGFLDGSTGRSDKRPLERIGVGITKAFNSVGLFRRYQPIKGEVVAKAMINASLKSNPGIHTWCLADIFVLAKS